MEFCDTILVCDDSVFLRKMLIDFLVEGGYRKIVETKNGIEAVESYKKFRPWLVFLDIVMPEKDGIQALKEIIAFDSGAKIIMLSSMGTNANIKAALDNGAIDFLQKPINQRVILEIVKKWSLDTSKNQ